MGEEAVDANLGRGEGEARAFSVGMGPEKRSEGEAALGTSSFTVAVFKEKCRA